MRAAAGVFGQLTRWNRVLPDFLIVGTQRGGTTSLFKALVQHPLVEGPTFRKGVHYFDVNHHRGPAFYRGHFPTRKSALPPVQVCESSPYYMFHPLAPERIARELPDTKILVALRDPVERAYSAYVHERARGFETETFERALELEPERLAGVEERLAADPCAYSHSHQHHAYLSRGQYVDQLERLEKHVGRDRIHVVESESFFRQPEENFEVIAGFLDLPQHSGIRFERHNARPRSSMDPALRDRLRAHFTPYDERLAQWWGRMPGWRR
nr:sulfotransferase domain-containing protein [Nocardiopsis ansamitocini]